MSKTTAKRFNALANGLEKIAQGIVNSMELIISDASGAKRSRKGSHRSYSRPIVIVKVIKEAK